MSVRLSNYKEFIFERKGDILQSKQIEEIYSEIENAANNYDEFSKENIEIDIDKLGVPLKAIIGSKIGKPMGLSIQDGTCYICVHPLASHNNVHGYINQFVEYVNNPELYNKGKEELATKIDTKLGSEVDNEILKSLFTKSDAGKKLKYSLSSEQSHEFMQKMALMYRIYKDKLPERDNFIAFAKTKLANLLKLVDDDTKKTILKRIYTFWDEMKADYYKRNEN
jgi:hypothetical protein